MIIAVYSSVSSNGDEARSTLEKLSALDHINDTYVELYRRAFIEKWWFDSGHFSYNRTLYHHRNIGERIDTLLCVE
jgi:hypothetical protein